MNNEDNILSPKRVVGTLQSQLSIALHSYYAIRLWQGRRGFIKEGEKRQSIIGMPYVIARAGQINQHSTDDNPYADTFLWKLEKSLISGAEDTQKLVTELDTVLNSLPANITLTGVASAEPLNIGVYSSSPLGYRCVWLLVGYDQLAIKTLQAFHYGLISRSQRDEYLKRGARMVRKVYGVVKDYRHFAVTRQDVSNNMPAGQEALKYYGLPDKDIMDGRVRSSFSVPLRKDK